jgi:spermidine synthase
MLCLEGIAMPQPRRDALAWWSALTILVSAFLLFQVQPIISKKILPWFGGSPAVWTTCVLFFQLVLLAGYAYAHWLIRMVPPRWQGPIHLTVLGLALLTFPITPAGYWNINPSDLWKPPDGNYPAARILMLLAAKVAAPFFVASTTGPLVQAWFARLFPGRSPYRLYALSNVGSLAALLTYPVLIEPMWRVDTQGVIWSLGFLLFAALVGVLARAIWHLAVQEGSAPASAAALGATKQTPADAAAAAPAADPPGLWLRAAWLGLTALASLSFLAITNHLCQDIAVVPFMWVVPLSLYLLSFIICFDSERWYLRKTFGVLTLLGIGWLTAVEHYAAVDSRLDYVQQAARVLIGPGPKFETPEAAEDYAKLSFREKVQQASPWWRQPFSSANDWAFKKLAQGVGWVQRWGKPPPGEAEPPLPFHVDTADFGEHVVAASTAYLTVLFLICMVCHGELVKSRPAPSHLTSFYLSISAGGALGGLFVGLVCPNVFKTHFELGLGMIGGFLVAWATLFNDGRDRWLKNREALQWVMAFLLVLSALVVVRGNLNDIELRRITSLLPSTWQQKLTDWGVLGKPDPDLIAIERNFYGTIRVERMFSEGDPDAGIALYNGRIWHGFQFLDPARQLEPSTYYVAGTGAALAVTYHPRAAQGLKVAVIGLGSGSMAAHGKEGDQYVFYEIDPKVVDAAYKYFTYLAKSPARPRVVLGDARVSLEREWKEQGSQNYDVIHLDAFSGDAIPAHLLTDEAFSLYTQHLHKDETGQPDGIIVVHISNRYLDLEPVVAAIAKKHGYQTWNVHKLEDGGPTDTSSDWVLVTRNRAFLEHPEVQAAGEPLAPDKELLWTDQYTALYPILR